MNLVPVARIFHLSDLHFAPGDIDAGLRQRIVDEFKKMLGTWGVRALHRLPLIDMMVEKLSGADPRAKRFLRSSLQQEAVRDSRWVGRTWLVATGDVSTWGDFDSVATAKDFLEELCRVAHLPSPIVIYGNHDVWIGQPGTRDGHPWFCWRRSTELDVHRSDLRARFFPDTWPLGPAFRVEIGDSGRYLAAYSLNTVLHDWWGNGWALGEVTSDRYWEANNQPSQLDELARKATADDVNLILTHHPVHDPRGWPVGQGTASLSKHLPQIMNVLTNAPHVASGLGAGKQLPLGRIIISGHTHRLFPDPGFLPGAPPIPPHQPLGNGQVQLGVGTATQWPSPQIRASGRTELRDQHYQLLHFYHEADRNHLVIERTILCRYQNRGTYRYYDPDGSGLAAEHLELDLR